MNVNIELTGICTKDRLLRELNNIIENIERFDRFDAIRNVPHAGKVKVTKEGEYSKYSLVDDDTNKVIRYYDDEEYTQLRIDQHNHPSAYIKILW